MRMLTSPLEVGPQNFVCLEKEFGKETAGSEANKCLFEERREMQRTHRKVGYVSKVKEMEYHVI